MGPSKPGLSDTTRPFSGNTYRFKLRVVNALCTWQGAWHLVGVLQVEFLLPFDSTDYPFPPSHIHSGRVGSQASPGSQWSAPSPQSPLVHEPCQPFTCLCSLLAPLWLVPSPCHVLWKGKSWRNDHGSEERRAMVSPDAWVVPGNSCLLRMGWLSLLAPTKKGKVKGQEAWGPVLVLPMSLHVARTCPFSRGL